MDFDTDITKLHKLKTDLQRTVNKYEGADDELLSGAGWLGRQAIKDIGMMIDEISLAKRQQESGYATADRFQ